MIVQDSIGGGFAGAVGIGLVTDQAFAAGVASVPTPVTESAWDGWIYHRFFDTRAASTATDTFAGSFERWEMDSKAMRKWDEDMTLFAVTEVVEAGVCTLRVRADSRLLVMLS